MRHIVFAFLLATGAARAETELHFAGYAGGAQVIVVTAAFDVSGPSAYRVRIGYRTSGPAAAIFPGGTDSVVTGRVVAGHPRPDHLLSSGQLRGQARLTEINYENETPRIVKMEPGNDPGREPVPEARQVRTVDGMTAMAELVRTVRNTGRCEGRSTVYDGRRLNEVEARTAGRDFLPATSRSSFSGEALHCAITSRWLAGFMPDTEDQFRKPQQASVWFAPPTPGSQPVPVRITIPTRYFGEASLYLID